MVKLPDSPKSSERGLRAALRIALRRGFRSALRGPRAALADEAVGAVLAEMEKYFADLGSVALDQLSGRLETKLAPLLGDGFALDEESVQRVRDALAADRLEKEPESVPTGATPGAEALADAVCAALNGIGKDKKLEEFREYLGGSGERGSENAED